MSFLEDLTEDVHQGEIVPKAPLATVKSQLAKVRELEDRVFEKATDVVDACLSAPDIPEDLTEPPPAWVDRFGEEDAARRLRIARHSLMSAKEAPVYLKVATSVQAGIMKVRAAEKSAPVTLNAQVVLIPAAELQMEELVVKRFDQ